MEKGEHLKNEIKFHESRPKAKLITKSLDLYEVKYCSIQNKFM